MSFLKPFMLLGMLGALIPVIIHLIHKRKPRKQPFGAIEFVLRSVEKVQRRWRLKRFLLLASRMLLILALAAAASHPLWGHEAAQLSDNSGPERIALVIDASLSMRARPNGDTSGFEQALLQAEKFLQAMGPEDLMTIVLAENQPRPLFPGLISSRADLSRALKGLKPGYAHVDLADAVSVASQIITRHGEPDEESPEQTKAPAGRVIILSDLSGHSFQQSADVDSKIAINAIDVFKKIDPSARNNHAVVDLVINPVPSAKANTVQARVRIRAFSGDQKPSKETLARNVTLAGPSGNLKEGSLDVVYGTIVEKTLEHSFEEPGNIGVSVQLEPDVLAEDDARYGRAEILRHVRTLIVDGAPSGLPKEDEIFYLERALSTGAKDQPLPQLITADDLGRTDLLNYDVVILAGVASIKREQGTKLINFVENGGGLLITASESLDIDQYNAVLGRILPRTLRGLKLKSHDENKKEESAVGLGDINLEHPVMKVFSGEAIQGLRSTKTRAYFLLQPNRAREAKILASYDDGQPALIETSVKKGRVTLLTTSIDRDLSDLPIRPAFVPLVRRLLLYLGGALSKPDHRATLIGEPRKIQAPGGTVAIEVIDPAQVRHEIKSSNAPGVFVFNSTNLPGQYRVAAQVNDESLLLEEEHFAVNVDPRESNLLSLSSNQAVAILRGQGGKESQGENRASIVDLAQFGLSNPDQIAMWLLILMLCAFVLESFITAELKASTQNDGSQPKRPSRWSPKFLNK